MMPEVSGGAVLGMGIDVVESSRVARLLRQIPAAYERLFSDHERAYAEQFADPFPATRCGLRQRRLWGRRLESVSSGSCGETLRCCLGANRG